MTTEIDCPDGWMPSGIDRHNNNKKSSVPLTVFGEYGFHDRCRPVSPTAA